MPSQQTEARFRRHKITSLPGSLYSHSVLSNWHVSQEHSHFPMRDTILKLPLLLTLLRTEKSKAHCMFCLLPPYFFFLIFFLSLSDPLQFPLKCQDAWWIHRMKCMSEKNKWLWRILWMKTQINLLIEKRRQLPLSSDFTHTVEQMLFRQNKNAATPKRSWITLEILEKPTYFHNLPLSDRPVLQWEGFWISYLFSDASRHWEDKLLWSCPVMWTNRVNTAVLRRTKKWDLKMWRCHEISETNFLPNASS